jgi:hypothetical protein
MWQGIGLGAAISVVTGLVTWVLFRWALGRGAVIFTRVFIAGIGVRLLVVGAAALLVLGLTEVHRLGFGAGLVGTYLVLLIGEVAYLLRRAQRLSAMPRQTGSSRVPSAVDTSGEAL